MYEIYVVVTIDHDRNREIVPDHEGNPRRFIDIDMARNCGESLPERQYIHWDILTLDQSRTFMRDKVSASVSGHQK